MEKANLITAAKPIPRAMQRAKSKLIAKDEVEHNPRAKKEGEPKPKAREKNVE